MEHFNVGENDWILLAADREGWDGCKEDYAQNLQRLAARSGDREPLVVGPHPVHGTQGAMTP